MSISRSSLRSIGGWTVNGKKNITYHQIMSRIAQLRRAVKDNYSMMSYNDQSAVMVGAAEIIFKITKEK